MDTTSAAAATPAPEGFTDAEWERFERFQAEKERRRIAAERFKAGLSTEKLLLRNETGGPLTLPRGCTQGAHELAKEIACDGADPVDRLRASKPTAAPGELFWVPPGHHQAVNTALPKVDPLSVADEPTVQDRLALGELRAAKEAVERPAIQAEKTEADLEAQERILAERKLQQRAEVARRRSHVQAVDVKINEFLSSRSEAWRTTILGAAAEASLESIRQAADTDRGHVGTMDQLRQAGGVGGPAAFMSGANGQPVKLRVDRSL